MSPSPPPDFVFPVPRPGDPPWKIRRTPVELPDDARAAVERGVKRPRGSAYRTHDAGDATPSAWWPVLVRPPPGRGRALFWPAVRTGVPASGSVALLSGLIALAGAVPTLGLIGLGLGSAVGAVIARTQYTLERDQHALGAIWLASDLSRVLVARYDSLPSRLSGRARWYVLPVETLAPPGDELDTRSRHALATIGPEPPAESSSVAVSQWRAWARRARRTARALSALGVDGASIDPLSAERIYMLARLARFRRFAHGAG